MKNLLVVSCLLLTFSITQAQTVTELDEVKIGFSPLDSKVQQIGNEFTYNIENVDVRDFINNPIKFMKANFNIKNFIAVNDGKGYNSYTVKIDSNKGSMVAIFDSDGDLLKTNQNFENILLPYELRGELYKENKGWAMIKNKFTGITKGEILTKEVYKIWLEKDDQRKTVKLKGSNDGMSVASLE